MPIFKKNAPPIKYREIREATRPVTSSQENQQFDLKKIIFYSGAIDPRKNHLPTHDEWLKRMDILVAGTIETNYAESSKKPMLPPTVTTSTMGVRRAADDEKKAMLPPGFEAALRAKSADLHKKSMEQDVQINMISSMVGALNLSSANGRVYILCSLYYATSNWLENIPQTTALGPIGGAIWLQQARRPAVQNLYMVVVRYLKWHLNLTSVELIPEKLKYFFGREMGAHGTESDKFNNDQGTLYYLNEADRDKFKIRFKDGIAHQLPWWIEEIDGQSPKKLSNDLLKQCIPILAESSRSPGTNGMIVPAPPLPPKKGVSQVITDAPGMFIDDFSGCVMDMGWNLYCAPHYGGFDKGGSKKNFFHSSYMQGEPIAFAGSIRIQKGRVTGICNDSGHYRPTQHHMIIALQALQFHGVDLSYVDVIAMIVSKHGVDKIWVGKGDTVLRNRDTLNALYQLDQEAQKHAYHKQKGHN
ncbi:hypothetical protein [Pelagibaculum spongiae]|uniref:Uncharacterized protein n=1 Tax=Pelagibaculum spongiae TaxID=2080658 RepID=A0A2V1GZB6_9GAMM|nr:hypothetical protein [Pelagibaculum spongiae]PVZ68335.1 hypothetical protein DC094_13705 [Pelagibaculum spongiae]